MILLTQMIILFAMMMVGLIAKRRNLITEEGGKVLSAIVVNIANPALILSASINKESVIEGRELLLVAGLSVCVYIFLMIVSRILVKILRMDDYSKSTYRVMTVFSNIGFMGFPLISATYGPQALLYASFFLIPYNVLIYTWGIRALTSNKDEAVKSDRKVDIRKILNIGVLSCVATIIIYIAKVPVPSVIESIVTELSNLTAPLSMIVIGAYLSKLGIKKIISDKKLILFSVIKQIAIPIIGVLILKCIGIENILVNVCMVILATPVGSMTAMLSEQYEGDHELASKGVALTTIMTVVTIPLVAYILGC